MMGVPKRLEQTSYIQRSPF